MLAQEVQCQQDTAITITSTAKSARDMALNARTASRVLQSLPTEVCRSTASGCWSWAQRTRFGIIGHN